MWKWLPKPEAYNPEASNFHSSVRNHAGVFLAVQSEVRKIFCPKYGIRELKASQSEANNEFYKSLALMSMKKPYFKFPRICEHQAIHKAKNIHILYRQSWSKSGC